MQGASSRAGITISKIGSGGGHGYKVGGGITGPGCGKSLLAGMLVASAALFADCICEVSEPRGLGHPCLVRLLVLPCDIRSARSA